MKPSSPETSARFRQVARRDTAPELRLRSELHRLGLRYGIDRRPVPDLRRRADIVFRPSKVAVFVDGCFWHGCPDHMTWPAANAEWWRAKIGRNRSRDQDTDRQLEAAGWTSIRIWEHEDMRLAARRIAIAVRGDEESFQMLFQELMDNYAAIEEALDEAEKNVSDLDTESLVKQGEVEATDAARRQAQELGVDLTEIEGTGSDGRITVDDVKNYAESMEAEEEPKASDAARRKAEELGVDLSQIEGSGAGGLITIRDVVKG